jgi:hypothetical protein
MEGVGAGLLEAEQQRSMVRAREIDGRDTASVEHASGSIVQRIDDLSAAQIREVGGPFHDPHRR